MPGYYTLIRRTAALQAAATMMTVCSFPQGQLPDPSLLAHLSIELAKLLEAEYLNLPDPTEDEGDDQPAS